MTDKQIEAQNQTNNSDEQLEKAIQARILEKMTDPDFIEQLASKMAQAIENKI